jgi:hypothetical protein
MSNQKHTGGPAFPREDYQTDDAPGQSGMTLRDYFAAKAMESLIAGAVRGHIDYGNEGDVARRAFEFADAMLAARQEQAAKARAWDKCRASCFLRHAQLTIGDVIDTMDQLLAEELEASQEQAPIPMVLHCPKCGMQHIDAPDERTPDWKNEPHRSHLCHGCGTIWRPADVPTTGVASVSTKGKADTWAPGQEQAQQPSGETFDQWLKRERPAGCVSDMERGWKACAASQQPSGGEVVAWCALTPSGKIAHFDGKPMVMVGPVGNDLHPTPLTLATPKPEPMTEEAVLRLWHGTAEMVPMCEHYKHFARAVEAHHGITKEQA